MDFPLQLTSQLREHLRAFRKTRGLTQAGLGLMLGVGQARIAEIESNPGVVSLDQLMKVLSTLRVSLVLRDDVVEAPTSRSDAMASPSSAPSDRPRATPQGVDPRKGDLPVARRDFVIHPKKGSW